MGDIGGQSKGGGSTTNDYTGQWNWGVSPFDINAIQTATGLNEQAVANRYDQLGLGGGTSTSTTTTPGTGTAGGSMPSQADMLQALGSMIPTGNGTYIAGPGTPAGVWGSGGGSTAGTGGTTTTTINPGSTMENQDLAQAGLAGSAALGQLQTQNAGDAALNPALQVAGTTAAPDTLGTTLGSLASAGTSLGKAASGA